MGILVYPKRFSEKPPLGIQVNRGHPLVNGLVSYWLFNEGGGLITYDSGLTNSGTLMSGPTWVSGRSGPAISFNGSNNYILVSSINGLEFGTAPFSVSFCFKTTYNADQQVKVVIRKDVYGAPRRLYSVEFNNGATGQNKLNFTCYDAGSQDVVYSTSAVNDGYWHHAVCLRDGTSLKIYLDGIINCTPITDNQIQTSSGTQASLYIASETGQTASYFFPGTINEVSIYNRALSPTEIQWLYAQPYNMFIQPRKYWFGSAGGAAIYADSWHPQIEQPVREKIEIIGY